MRHKKYGSWSTSREYGIWREMLRRCKDRRNKMWHRYGGRGIKVCDSWKDLVNFAIDMGRCPPGGSLDRIDNDGDYCKENCRWAKKKEQDNNRITNILIPYKGKTQTLMQWAEELNLSYGMLRYRIRVAKWRPDVAFETPSKKSNTGAYRWPV